MAEIVITEFMDEAAVAKLSQQFSTHYDPTLGARQDAIPPLLGGASALIVRNRTKVSKELLKDATDLRCVGRLGVGLDNIDLETCKARGIEVFPATGANNRAVAEYVIATAMILVRGAYHASAEVAAGKWPRERLMGGEVAGRVLGLVGFGAIAQETAELAAGLGMKLLAYDPFLPDIHPAWAMAQRREFAELLAEADIVSLHVPLSGETRHLIDEAALAQMKPSAILINAARGGVVDETALAKALRAGKIGGAALDVFEAEPLDAKAGKQLAGIANLILTPHIAGVTEESNVRVSDLIADRVLAHLGKTG
jgi:(S)-sulfolactate dehydrogenase